MVGWPWVGNNRIHLLAHADHVPCTIGGWHIRKSTISDVRYTAISESRSTRHRPLHSIHNRSKRFIQKTETKGSDDIHFECITIIVFAYPIELQFLLLNHQRPDFFL